MNAINKNFKLEPKEKITDFFFNDSDRILDKLKPLSRRVKHYFRTQIWIHDALLLKYVQKFPNQKISYFFAGKSIYRKLLKYENNGLIPKSQKLKDSQKFLWEFIKHPTRVGAILPSSHYLAREIVKQIPKNLKRDRTLILEIGPGTGAFTDKIVTRMNLRAGASELHLVEYDPIFCKKLREKYRSFPNIKIFQGSILDHTLKETCGRKYDYVISGLPLNSFKSDFVQRVFAKFVELVKEGGKISYFEYLCITRLKRVFLNKAAKENIDNVGKIKQLFYEKHGIGKGIVLRNIPSARVLHHSISSKFF